MYNISKGFREVHEPLEKLKREGCKRVKNFTSYPQKQPLKFRELSANSTYTIRWNAPAMAKKFNLEVSHDNGATWQTQITGYLSKSYTWNITTQDKRKGSCKIRIRAFDASNNTLATIESRPFSTEVRRILAPKEGN